ncbi:MAG: hypothetical protein LBQ66_11790 [Planctomycetaceae bacterium]|jgi:DNA repair exonuclease SbcCD nuclease subunit|nr:hypothetical protein [Planctomycetaceae bacterium]
MSPTSVNIPLRQRLPLRFIHASGLFLDKTIEQVSEMPTILESRFLDLSQRATLRLFRKAIDESVDFVILSGDVLNAEISPPGLFLFLIDQFEQLKKAGITVFWAGSEFDSPEDLPIAFPLPDNVHLFPANSIQEYFFKRVNSNVISDKEFSGNPLARIVGMSRNQRQRRIRSNEFPIDPGRLFTIAVANGDVDPDSLSQRRIDYWAMGGINQRQTYLGNPRKKGTDGKPIQLDPPDLPDGTKRDRKDLPPPPFTLHYPGTTVARSPDMLGQFGATLVEVNWGEEPILTFFTTSPVRWVNDQITLDAEANLENLTDEIQSRIKNYQNTQKDEDLMISWFIDIPPTTQLAANLRKGIITNNLLNELRKEYGQGNQITWSVDISILLPDMLPKQLYEQQTIAGDFLRAIKHHQNEPEQTIDLSVYLPTKLRELDQEELDNGGFDKMLLADKIINTESGEKKLVQSTDQITRKEEILRKAAVTGMELLTNENQNQFTINLKKPEDNTH